MCPELPNLVIPSLFGQLGLELDMLYLDLLHQQNQLHKGFLGI